MICREPLAYGLCTTTDTGVISRTVPDPRLFRRIPAGAIHSADLNEIRYQAERLEAGHIRLRFGEHFGPNRGYGVHHIIAEHRKSLKDHPDGIVMAAVRFGSKSRSQGPRSTANSRPSEGIIARSC